MAFAPLKTRCVGDGSVWSATRRRRKRVHDIVAQDPAKAPTTVSDGAPPPDTD